MTNRIAIAGIHTGIGKTIVSAVIAEALQADYWKPIQAGIAERDSTLVQDLISQHLVVHPEAFLLTQPLSPHAAARIDGVHIDHKQFTFPITNNLLLVETAGGIMSPVSHTATVADFIIHYNLPTILVVKNYLGSINHTLLCIELCKSRGINLLGIVMNGEPNTDSETFITQYTHVPIIAHVPDFKTLDRHSIRHCADGLRLSLQEKLNYGKH